jgi:hypothetical protein
LSPVPVSSTVLLRVRTKTFFISAALIVVGCATQGPSKTSHVVKVNAVALEAPQKGTAFTIVPARGAVDDSTLLYAEAARVVTNALQTKGMYAAPRVEKANVIVELEYGMAPPRAIQRANPTVAEPLPREVRAGVPTETDVANLRSSARGPLEKHLVLTAREASRADDSPPRTLWKVDLSTVDLSNDLRKYLPLLATVALDEIGQDSGGDLLIRVDENNKSTKLLKKAE